MDLVAGPSIAVDATTVDVPIYLRETGTDQIQTDGGLYSFGFTLSTVAGTATVLDLQRSAASDRRVTGSTTAFNVAPPVRLWAQQESDENFGNPPPMDSFGKIFLATARLRVTSGTFEFEISDFEAGTGQTVTYALNPLDADIVAGRLTVVVPEPSVRDRPGRLHAPVTADRAWDNPMRSTQDLNGLRAVFAHPHVRPCRLR